MSTEEGSSSCVITIDESNRWIYEPCIYKIPDHIARENPKLYQPQLVYLGLYQGIRYDWELPSSIDKVKLCAANEFIRRSKAASSSGYDYYEPLLKLSDVLALPYKHLEINGRDSPKFTKGMVQDGIFILEILRMGTSYSNGDSKPFFELLSTLIGNMHVVPIIKQDMLLLQNQVPFWLLEYILFSTDAKPEKLRNYKAGDQTGKGEELLDLIVKFYSLPESARKITPPYLHILDIYRRGLISQDINRDDTEIKDYVHDEAAQYFPSASKLYEAAIPFEKSLTANLKDVSYHRGKLRLPQFLITKDTVQTLANLMAFEKLHLGDGNEITSYVFVLNCLIHNARDVSLLESHDVIRHTLRDDEDVVKSFGLISNDVAYPPHNMLKDIQIVSQQVRDRRFRKRLNIWRLDLLEKYLNTPWGALSVVGAILLFTLSIIQTVYSVLSYIHRK